VPGRSLSPDLARYVEALGPPSPELTAGDILAIRHVDKGDATGDDALVSMADLKKQARARKKAAQKKKNRDPKSDRE
jgi:hypothetical protein